MKARAWRLVSPAAATAMLAAPTVSAGAADAETPPVQITVHSPVEGATVAGTSVGVAYTVTTAPGEWVDRSIVAFAGAVRSSYIGGSCETGCTFTVAFDTTAVPSTPTAPDAGEHADGPQTVRVSAKSTTGSASVDVGVDLENGRPAEGLAPPELDPQATLYDYTATDSLHLEANPTARPGGSIASMALHYMSNIDGMRKVQALQPPVEPGAPWTLDFDTSTAQPGTGSVWVTATDERGVRSIGRMVYYAVHHGFGLTGPDLTGGDPSGSVPDFALDEVPLEYSYPVTEWGTDRIPDTHPVRVTTYLDGEVMEEHDPSVVFPPDPPGVVTARSGGRVAPGEHDVRYVVTDNRGVSEEVNYRLTVRKTLEIAWTRGPGLRVLPAHPLTLEGVADAVDTTVSGVDFYVDDTVLDTWRCTTDPCPAHLDATGTDQPSAELYTPGEHEIRMRVWPRDGLPMVTTGTFTVLPYAQSTLDPRAPVVFGRTITLTGRTELTGGDPAPDAVVTLQRRPVTGGPWKRVATDRSGSDGAFTFRVRAGRSARYRVRTPEDASRWAGGAGDPVLVRSHADLRLTHRPTSGRLTRYVAVRGTVAPARPRARVYLQESRGGHWFSVDRTRPDADGTFRLHYRVVNRRSTRVRVVRPAAGGVMTTRTRWWRIAPR